MGSTREWMSLTDGKHTHTRGCLHLHLEDTLTRSLTRFEPTKLKNKHLKDTKTTGTWMLAHTFFTGEACLPNLRVCSCIVLTCLVTAIISEQLLIKQCRGSTVLMSLSNRQDEATWPGLMWEVWLLAVGVFFQSLFTVLCLWEWFLIKVFFFSFSSLWGIAAIQEKGVCVCVTQCSVRWNLLNILIDCGCIALNYNRCLLSLQKGGGGAVIWLHSLWVLL